MAPNKILCVAEKPSIAKAVANILGGGRVTTVRIISYALYLPLPRFLSTHGHMC